MLQLQLQCVKLNDFIVVLEQLRLPLRKLLVEEINLTIELINDSLIRNICCSELIGACPYQQRPTARVGGVEAFTAHSSHGADQLAAARQFLLPGGDRGLQSARLLLCIGKRSVRVVQLLPQGLNDSLGFLQLADVSCSSRRCVARPRLRGRRAEDLQLLSRLAEVGRQPAGLVGAAQFR